ncbi:cell envelope biogenesis protein TolA, partial [Escherichia coli]|nr:cell envelope biogenesis protein TolA [Escherichia coli]
MLLTEIEAAKQIRDGQLPSPYQFSNMWLVNLRITGTGMAYRAEEKEFVWRSPQTYLNPQFLERCAGVPVIIDHPE